MRRRALLVAAVAALGAAAGCSSGPGAAQPVGNDQRYVPGDGRTIVFPRSQRKAAPGIGGSTMDAAEFDLPSLHRVVVVNFWASWCPPCRAEAADLEAAYQATKEKVSFIGVDTRDQEDAAKAFMKGRVNYPSLFDPQGHIALEFTDVPPNTLPATVIVDKAAKVAAVIRAPVGQAALIELVNRIDGET
jgi:thiol-disulfide isomerase/thioredoxin